MKKILLVLVLFFVGYATCDAQAYAVAASKKDYVNQKAAGVIVFRFGSDVTPENLLSTAENFQEFFTTKFDATKYEGTFTMKENVEMNRLMLGRLLIGIGVEVIEFDGVQMPVFQFSNDYLK